MPRWKVRLGRSARTEGPPGVGGKLVATLFFGFFLGIGGLFVYLVGREAAHDLATWDWAKRRCEITASEVVREGGEDPYAPRVAFRTVDAGEPRSGNAIGRSAERERTHGAAAAALAPYPVGSTTACHAGPEGELILERGSWAMPLLGLFPLVFVAIGAIGLFATWRPAKTDAFGRPVPESLGAKASGSAPGRTLRVLGAILALVGAGLFWFLAAKPLLLVVAARGWERHPCTVEHSSVLSHASDDGTTYSVDILYRWDRGRGVERSSRHAFFGGSTSGRSAKAAIVRAHPPGAEVPCWVDPERRNEAVLERGLTAEAWLVALPVGLLAIGLGLYVAGRRVRARRTRMRESALRGESPIAAEDPLLDVLPAFESTPGPVTLRAASSRWGRVIGFVAMGLFWNGIVAVFVNEAWQTHARGRPDWFLTLFLVPFLLVGIGIVAGVVHAVLALRNPRPVLVANTTSPHLGGRLTLQWRFEGHASRIAHLRLAVKGLERATYQVGTDTRTVTEDFFEEVLVDRPAPMGAMDGAATFDVPDDTMHSFESEHNAVVWQLELVGEVPRWPDVSETYALVVLPEDRRGRRR